MVGEGFDGLVEVGVFEGCAGGREDVWGGAGGGGEGIGGLVSC